MHVELLAVTFHLPGCRSLKDKRRALSGLRDRFGKQTNMAVCESDFQNEHQRAQWTFIAASSDSSVVDSMLNAVNDFLDSEIDAVVVDVAREEL